MRNVLDHTAPGEARMQPHNLKQTQPLMVDEDDEHDASASSSGSIDEDEPVLDKTGIAGMKVAELRHALASRNLSQLGSKAALQQRHSLGL